ncbi:hypothetical protein MOQ_004194 [Trypanosoma cruzi marinkellei]|uniref:Uncharacterized protein n=1 Tax=Trypanosoma cruzi marinkellei TaxID=85056 RepID=K2N1V9_TRYCR|nr:hypothetical protein MOQ_004194 [Trypanosoma cruzi marinkellei]
MHQTTCVLLLCGTCTYWVMALLVLLLRVFEPHLRNVTCYGGRHAVAAATVDDKDNNNNNNSIGDGVQKSVSAGHKVMGYFTTHGGLFWEAITLALSGLESSILCRLRLSRKRTFCAFYLTGIFFFFLLWQLDSRPFPVITLSALSSDALNYYEALPLVSFFIHCAVRLWECQCVHCFRGGPRDTVTLFAALAGCSFYMFAAISSSPIVCCVTQTMLFVGDVPHFPRSVEASSSFSFFVTVTVVSFFFHLFLQTLQMFHHVILARMRDKSTTPSNSFDAAVSGRKQHFHDVHYSFEASVDKSGSFYRFPNAYLFKYVMEPHYTCEILMYVLNVVSMWACIGRGAPSIIAVWHSKGVQSTLLLATSYATPLGVLLFSLFNLAITASEHRIFWNQLNERRERKEHIPPWNLFYRVW